MITEYKRSIGFICPQCGLKSTSSLTPFNFSGNHTIAAFCHSPFCCMLCATLKDEGKEYFINVMCPVCGEPHDVRIPKANVWKKPLTSVACRDSNIDCFVIGEAKEVQKALAEGEKKLAEIVVQDDDFFGDYMEPGGNKGLSLLIVEIVNNLKFLQENEALSCRCGSSDINISIVDNKICFRCGKCRSIRQIEPSEEYLQYLYNAEYVTFNK